MLSCRHSIHDAIALQSAAVMAPPLEAPPGPAGCADLSTKDDS